MFNYSYLETLYAVEMEGTFERAAKSRGVSRSAISQNIQMLEDRWGSATIARKPVRPTKWGQRLCRHVDQVRLMETSLFLEYGHLFNTSEFEPTPINLMVDKKVIPTGILDSVALVREWQSPFVFQSNLYSTRDLVAKLSSMKIQAALSTEWINHSDYIASQLGVETFYAVASPEFFAARFGTGVNMSTLLNATSISYSEETNFCSKFVSMVFGEARSTNTTMLPSNHGMLKACLGGKAWGMLPNSLISDHIASGELIRIHPDQPYSVKIYWYVSKLISSILPQVTDMILESVKEQSTL